jgi:hypothetical protein
LSTRLTADPGAPGISEGGDMDSSNQNQFIDVTQPPFNARGDGETDDAPAVQKAVDALQGVEARLRYVEQRPDANEEQRN